MIDVIEVASDIAEYRVTKLIGNTAYLEDDGVFYFTEEAQDTFNIHYDRLQEKLVEEVYEGWTALTFIDELNVVFLYYKGSFDEIEDWCIDNQPYYKKAIPLVREYFQIRFNERNN